jgi:hypothetical protein
LRGRYRSPLRGGASAFSPDKVLKRGPGDRSFNIVLTGDECDCVVAEWLNRQPNVSELIQALIYAVATGDTLEGPTSWLEPGVSAQDLDHDDPRVQALWGGVDA